MTLTNQHTCRIKAEKGFGVEKLSLEKKENPLVPIEGSVIAKKLFKKDYGHIGGKEEE